MRLASLVEATTVTGPMKPLLMFSKHASGHATAAGSFSHFVLTTSRRVPDAGPSPFESAARAVGADVRTIPERGALDPRVVSGVRAALESIAPDVIESHDFKSHFLLYLVRRLAPSLAAVPWIAFHHGYTRMSWRVRAYQQLDRVSLPHADRVLTLCRPFVRELVERGVPQERIDVLSNAVSPREPPAPEEVAAIRGRLDPSGESRLLLVVGRLSPEKGHLDLFRAMPHVERRAGGVRPRLVVVGDGGERARLQAAATRLALDVVFVGHVSDPWPYYFVADAFVLPSHSEGSPLVLFEAMAAGLPVVATRVGGVPEVVEDGRSALLVPPRRPDLLGEAIGTVLQSHGEAEALGSAAKVAVAEYSPESYTSRMLGRYRSVLDGRAPKS